MLTASDPPISSCPSLSELNNWLTALLHASYYAHERNGIWKDTTHSVQHLVLALEPWAGLLSSLEEIEPDAIWLHRPYNLLLETLPESCGVIGHHLPFDETLTMGFNPYLAQVIGMQDITPFGKKRGRPIGMLGNISPQTSAEFRDNLKREFNGLENVVILNEQQTISRVAVAGAMTEALLKEALKGGAQLYLTGAFRPRAMQRIPPFLLPVIATGHARCEAWGLRELARLVKEKWPAMQVTVVAG